MPAIVGLIDVLQNEFLDLIKSYYIWAHDLHSVSLFATSHVANDCSSYTGFDTLAGSQSDVPI